MEGDPCQEAKSELTSDDAASDAGGFETEGTSECSDESAISLGNASSADERKPYVKQSRVYKARVVSGKPSVRLHTVLGGHGLCVCFKAALFFLGAPWLKPWNTC